MEKRVVMIERAKKEDCMMLAGMAVKMWGNHTKEKLAEEFGQIMEGGESVFFLVKEGNKPIGFAQCQLRHDYVEGTDSSPVGYLEGIFVEETYRKCGYAKQLLQACETWAKEQGCTEFASDCELANTESLQFHLNVGFEEANRIICFKKKI